MSKAVVANLFPNLRSCAKFFAYSVATW